MDRVGFVGLGSMGSPMATHLVEAGFDMAVYDIRAPAVEKLTTAGARAMGSPREVAERSEITIVMVVDDEQTREVVAGSDGLLAGARPGSIVVLSSSLRPGTVRDLHAIARPKEVEIIDAPVTGPEPSAIAGTPTFLVGGEEATFQRVRPVLQAMGKQVVHVGPLGSGQVLKTVNNVILWAEVAATSEALVLAAHEGVGAEDVARAMRFCTGNNWPLQNWEVFDRIPWAGKDLSITLSLAEKAGVSMPVAGLVRELLKGWRKPDPPHAG